MTNDERNEEWLARIAAQNRDAMTWSARFSIDGRKLVEGAVKALDAIGVSLTSNGAEQEYLVRFPANAARDVTRALLEHGASLCADQVVAPVP